MDPPQGSMTLPSSQEETPEEDISEFESEDSGEYPIVPTIDTPGQVLEEGNRFVDYSIRGPRDVILSGPLTGGWGPGRWFKNRSMAYLFVVDKYGVGRVSSVRERAGRWAYLIKNLRAE